jgi:hypothetical protein
MKTTAAIEKFLGEIRWIAEEVAMLCHEDTPWANVLGAVAVAAITGNSLTGARLLEGHYSGEEADAVFSLLEDAASLLED